MQRVGIIVGVVIGFGLGACGGKSAPPEAPIAKPPADREPPPGPVATGTGGDMYGGGMYGGDAYGGVEGGVEGGVMGGLIGAQPPLQGRWVSSCDKGAAKGQFVRLTYELTDASWTLASEVFADATCTKRKSAVTMKGAYQLGAPSAVAANAWETSATTARKLGKACKIKLTPGAPADIHVKGCAALGAVPEAELCTELDIAAVDGATGELRTGARAGTDLCTAEHRPKTLGPVAFVPHWTPVGVAECDAMGAEYERIGVCAKFPQQALGDLRSGMREINASCADIPAATAAMVCGQVLPQITEAAAKIGC